ncbi:hypothetical protein [Paraburkholderia caribensis]|uniref:hypothetical protein n=1 Tax=Paraburkholderia caribensis TaxID=75105 RepID=UPI0031D3A62D
MSNATILTHPAFDRPPVLNAKRRGALPRDIVRLKRVRAQRQSECWVLSKWAHENGIEPVIGGARPLYDYDKVRELKTQREAREAAENGLYGSEMKDISEMRQTLVKLYAAINIREKRILEQTTREVVNRIARDMNLPVRYD